MELMNGTRIQAKGLTLIELLATLAILGVALSLAIPAFDIIRARSAMTSSVNLFLAQLHLARATAIERERHITLCPATSGTACINDHRRWGGGYLIFEDRDRDRFRDQDEPVISFVEQAANGIRIVSSSRQRNRISFRALGRAWFSNTTVRFCDQEDASLNHAVIISNNGRIRVVTRLHNGSAITCD